MEKKGCFKKQLFFRLNIDEIQGYADVKMWWMNNFSALYDLTKQHISVSLPCTSF